MTEHFTAWVTNDTSALTGTVMDVVVLADELHGYIGDTPQWASSGNQVFYAETSVDVREGSLDDVEREAEDLLRAACWTRTGKWDAVDTGMIATVERI